MWLSRDMEGGLPLGVRARYPNCPGGESTSHIDFSSAARHEDQAALVIPNGSVVGCWKEHQGLHWGLLVGSQPGLWYAGPGLCVSGSAAALLSLGETSSDLSLAEGFCRTRPRVTPAVRVSGTPKLSVLLLPHH